MELGIKPRKIKNNSPPIGIYERPLPPPPTGKYWERSDDGSWKLMEKTYTQQSSSNNEVTTEDITYTHVVLPNDTLQVNESS